MRKFILFICTLVLLTYLSACSSENVKLAKEAYDAGDYVQVVELLESEADLNKNANEMLIISKAYISYAEKDYFGAIELLLTIDDGKDLDLYEESKNSLIGAALKDEQYEGLADAIEVDADFAVEVKDILLDGCDGYDYSCFKTLYGISAIMDNSSLKEELMTYAEDNKEKRAMAFLVGTWEWQSNCDTNTRVNNIVYEDNMLATVEIVGDNEKEYQILEGDIYWKDFVFIDENNFTCINLCKTKMGTSVECLTTGQIDYENDSLSLHLTAPEPYRMVDADRDWIRVK